TAMYSLSLHDALPIYGCHGPFVFARILGCGIWACFCRCGRRLYVPREYGTGRLAMIAFSGRTLASRSANPLCYQTVMLSEKVFRSEEHTSELQSRENL